ncbi:bifunctional endo-1,4-beta-xylanase XylA-like [Crassostrea angulata]|uniref:bifunctional endo-1,4-beta-xylanase XylA-like n=1 Tax=Magallana angulata TaxID=2784310 RepID=UPI0022B180B7|nr:bifunctional endo-1,4-beta-xylanase XylA-like [Crassostrea angulata]
MKAIILAIALCYAVTTAQAHWHPNGNMNNGDGYDTGGWSGWSDWTGWNGWTGWSGWNDWNGWHGMAGWSGWNEWNDWTGWNGWSDWTGDNYNRGHRARGRRRY